MISTERQGWGRVKREGNVRRGNVAYLIPTRLIGFRAVIKADKREGGRHPPNLRSVTELT